jgi:xylan 1,4-beta-xylosidase
MAPWLANTVRECVGLVDMMSYWTFSDVFEEQGVVKEPFYGGYGLMAARGIPKPAFNAFALLHKLGDRQYAISSPYALATRRADGAFVVALWNPLPEKPALSTAATPDKIRQFNLRVDGLDGTSMATLYRLDADHGNTLALYTQMGKPRYPTSSQIDELRVGAQMVAERIPANNGRATINVPAGGLVVVELSSLPQRTP